MKTLVLYLVLVAMATTAYAQEITELNEAKVGFAPLSSDVLRNGDSFSYKVNESYANEFERDPLAFMDSYFNIDNFISQVEEEEYDSYVVTFKSENGNLKADFNGEGDLVRSDSKFKNMLLPEDLREQIYKDHQGWVMVKNVRITSGNDGLISKDIYKVKLKNGKDTKRIVLNAPLEGSKIVSN